MTKQDLENIRWLNDRINFHLERRDYLKSKAYPGAIQYDDIGGHKPMVFDSLGDLYAEIDLEERKADKLIDRRHKLKQKAIEYIRRYCDDPAERHVMYLRYLGTIPHVKVNLEWSEVMKCMKERHNIQERRVWYLHHVALCKIRNHNI